MTPKGGWLRLRRPYVGDGADGARRSAQIDREEADSLPVGEDRDRCLVSAERWIVEAEQIEHYLGPAGSELAR